MREQKLKPQIERGCREDFSYFASNSRIKAWMRKFRIEDIKRKVRIDRRIIAG
jgi:hypothetical protein